ncbi:MAG: division/cell wall cluster transcriptional repressor MraZ [Clostridia bacterium]
MFLGTCYNSIDAKNRMIMPSKHRDQLGGRCVLTKVWTSACTSTHGQWERQMDKIAELPESDPNHVPPPLLFQRHRSGIRQARRIVLTELKEYAASTRIWSHGRYEEGEVSQTWEAGDKMNAKDFAAALRKYNF